MKISFSLIGWIVAAVLFLLLMVQRSCNHPATVGIHPADTIRVKGDTKLIKVQDTIIHTKYRYITKTADSNAIIADYYRKYADVYTDTVKGNDVVVSINDSLEGDTAIHRKVSIQNKRDKVIINQHPVVDEKFKIFFGFNAGLNLNLTMPVLSPTVIFLTQKDNLYQASFDLISRTPTVGMCWKIHLGK